MFFTGKLEALKLMTKFRDEKVSAFIGPDESCRNEALIASSWNLPMIAYVRKYNYNDIRLILKKYNVFMIIIISEMLRFCSFK